MLFPARCFFAILVLVPAVLLSATELPSIIGSGMVLQRACSVPVWGWDAPGTTVRVGFRGSEVAATAESDGRWEAQVASGAAGGPFVLTISGSTAHRLDDILVGEVWIAGGQSNMWWQLRNCSDGAAAIAGADQPQLRWYDTNTGEKEGGWPADQPARSVATRWQVSHPSVADDFAGTAYFFARRLQAKLGMPVGIIHLAVPGTAIEQWLSAPLLAKAFPEMLALNDRLRADPAAGGTDRKAIDFSRLANGMVAPCAPFAARGFLWWQGEANANDHAAYRTQFPALIDEWRSLFRLPTAPFLFVELAGFGTRAGSPVEDAAWPALRDAQRSALAVRGTAMVCTLDILDNYAWEIHPPRKQLAGDRLFLAAQAIAYGVPGEWSGPQPARFVFAGAQTRVSCTHAEGLRARDGGPLEGFAVAGADRIWHAAQAHISGTDVVVTAADEPAPVAVRYAWRNNPRECNLENAAGLPASAFRSDSWPLCAQP